MREMPPIVAWPPFETAAEYLLVPALAPLSMQNKQRLTGSINVRWPLLIRREWPDW